MEDIVKEVLAAIQSDETVEDRPLPLGNHTPVKISEDNFRELPPSKETKISFIDGGNAEILGASSFSLQFMRVAEMAYPRRRRKDEFYVLISFKDGKFRVKTFPDKGIKVEFDSLEPSLRTGNERVVAQKVAGVCRRLAELQACIDSDSEIVVLDGDLYGRTAYENEMLRQLRERKVAGLCKTTGLMTERGRVMAAVLNNMKNDEWYYSPVFRGGDVTTVFTRLHPGSHVFRLDTFSEPEEILSALQRLSKDPIFPGYPYGLVEADRMARISNKEKEYLKTKFMTEFGKDWSEVKTYLMTGDAHDILDNVG